MKVMKRYDTRAYELDVISAIDPEENILVGEIREQQPITEQNSLEGSLSYR